MRREWREVLGLFWGLFLAGTTIAAAPPDGKNETRGPGEDPVRLTVELIGVSRRKS